MLKDYVKSVQPDDEALKSALKDERAKLFGYQMRLKEARLPVMVIFEGWDAAGKGSVLGKVIKNIDPRFFQVATMDAPPTPDEKRRPFLYRYFVEIPEAGKFKFFDTCWMKEVTEGMCRKDFSEEDYLKHIDSINMTEQKAKEAPKMSKKQQEEAKKKAEKENKAKERNKKLAEEEAKKKAEAEKKDKQKAEQQRRDQARQQAREEEAKKEAEQKAKRKAEAQKAREQKAQRNAANKKSANKSANLLNTPSSKLSQSQRNDSIRNAKYKGRKTNKSSADND